jgi:hypothetical protein
MLKASESRQREGDRRLAKAINDLEDAATGRCDSEHGVHRHENAAGTA